MRCVCLALGLLLLAACDKPAAAAKRASPDAGSDAGVVAVVVVPCPKGATYTACGCGCCPGAEGSKRKCIDTAHGESLASVEARDRAHKADPNCAVMGCSLGTVYECCDLTDRLLETVTP